MLFKKNYNLDRQVPRTYKTGEVTDISHICNFKWYEWVKFRRIGPEATYPFPSEHLGRCLGPSRSQGNSMSQYVLLESGKVIPIQTLRSLTEAEVENPSKKARRDKFGDAIKKLYGDTEAPPDGWVQRRRRSDDDPQYDPDDDDGFRINDENWQDYALRDVDGGEVVNFKENGVIDPMKVTRLALENAASIAGTVLLTECTLTQDKQSIEEKLRILQDSATNAAGLAQS